MKKIVLCVLICVYVLGCAVSLAAAADAAAAQDSAEIYKDGTMAQVAQDIVAATSEEPTAPTAQPEARPIATLTSNTIRATVSETACGCCAQCAACFDPETGARTAQDCACVDEDGNFLGCGCACPFVVHPDDEGYEDAIAATEQIYDSNGDIAAGGDAWRAQRASARTDETAAEGGTDMLTLAETVEAATDGGVAADADINIDRRNCRQPVR